MVAKELTNHLPGTSSLLKRGTTGFGSYVRRHRIIDNSRIEEVKKGLFNTLATYPEVVDIIFWQGSSQDL
jgi:hypothetical protein